MTSLIRIHNLREGLAELAQQFVHWSATEMQDYVLLNSGSLSPDIYVVFLEQLILAPMSFVQSLWLQNIKTATTKADQRQVE